MLTHITITDIHGQILIQGHYSSYAHCLGAAAARGISLAGANLARLDLRAAELDEADLRGADFTGAHLAGANMSQCHLQGCNFTHANLADACMACSDLRQARFLYCRIGATDITGAQLDNCQLAGPDIFTLPFAECASMAGCLYYEEDGSAYALTRPPVVITGLPGRVVIMDNCIKYGAGPARPFPVTTAAPGKHICMS